MKKMIVTFCLLSMLINVFATDDKKEVQASLKSVTVYRQGAEMVHSVSVTLATGNMQKIKRSIFIKRLNN
jgi:hydroxyethylthiazole kinase-like sugar kinase family protein